MVSRHAKRGSKRGVFSGSPRGWGRGRPVGQPPAMQFTARPYAAAQGLTMEDEARNTVREGRTWDRDSRLRYKPVAFVSGGMIEPLKELADKAFPHASAIPDPQAGLQELPEPDPDPGRDPDPNSVLKYLPIDTGQQDALASAGGDGLKLSERETMTTLSASSEPLPPAAQVASEHRARPVASPQEDPTHDDTFFIDLEGDLDNHVRDHGPVKVPERPNSSGHASDSSTEVILFKGRDTSRIRTPCALQMSEVKEEIIVLEQTIQMQESSHQPTPLPFRNKGAGISEERRGLTRTSASKRRSRAREARRAEEDDIQADYMKNMDTDIDQDALSVLYTSRDLGGCDGDVDFGQASAAHLPSGDDDKNSAPQANSGNEEAEEDSEGEGSQDEGEMENDDGSLARLLAKQEELGLGSNNQVLFDGNFTGILTDDFDSITLSKKRLKKGTKTSDIFGKHNGNFPNATALAERFEDELDLMAWNQPALPAKKTKNAPPPFDVADPDLAEAMRLTWQKDRQTKKDKKLEREDLRAKGLLGKNVNPEDLHVKYQGGMTIDDIKEELWNFLQGTDSQLMFPPLDKHARKLIHEIACKFKITSKSSGKGDTRYPSLTRTKQTIRCDDYHFQAVMNRINRKYFHRQDQKGSSRRHGVGGGTGRANTSAVNVQDGEVVGSGAPEIGASNIGRAMLEKMGWSTGTALGAHNNKGILQPVTHTVKKTKAGLG